MHRVTIQDTGEQFTLPHNAYLADAAELALVGLVFGCRAGACGTCVIEVTAGPTHFSPPEDKERSMLSFLGFEQTTIRLACQCRLQGDVTIKQL